LNGKREPEVVEQGLQFAINTNLILVIFHNYIDYFGKDLGQILTKYVKIE